jgi:hypothetical protein
MRALIVLFFLVLTGCIATSSLTVMPLYGTGGPYKGTAQGSGSGAFKLDIDGKLYEGQWALVGSGSIGVASLTGPDVRALGYSASASPGTGIANARASDGSIIRCEFTFSSWSNSGFGVCEDSDGRGFDLFIN